MMQNWPRVISAAAVLIVIGVVYVVALRPRWWTDFYLSHLERNDCNCYTAADGECPADGGPPKTCNHTQNICNGLVVPETGKNADGFCDPPYVRTIDLIKLHSDLKFLFDSYLELGTNGGGRLSSSVVAALTLPRPLPQKAIYAVNEILDIVLGWDFVLPTWPDVRGSVPKLEGARLGIVQAAKAAVLESVEGQSVEPVGPALHEFWKTHPEFRPNHTGRCYPHGHPDLTDAEACQIREISAILRSALAVGRESTR
jgi:hypothetical protein